MPPTSRRSQARLRPRSDRRRSLAEEGARDVVPLARHDLQLCGRLVDEHGDARLEAGALLDLPPERIADAPLREDHVPELILLARVGEPGQFAAFADDDDGEVLPACVALPDRLGDLL